MYVVTICKKKKTRWTHQHYCSCFYLSEAHLIYMLFQRAKYIWSQSMRSINNCYQFAIITYLIKLYHHYHHNHRHHHIVSEKDMKYLSSFHILIIIIGFPHLKCKHAFKFARWMINLLLNFKYRLIADNNICSVLELSCKLWTWSYHIK